MKLIIDPAQDEDLAEIADLAHRSFAETYDWYNPPERIAAYVAEHLTEAAFRRELAQPGNALLRASVAGETLGYAQIGPGQTPAEVTLLPALELKRFYVASAWHGRGIARPLMEALLGFACDQGYRSVWLGVWECNDRAIAFYRKCGYQPAGTVVFQFADDPQTDILMVYPLS